MGRYTVVNSPDKWPGQCRGCGSAVKSPLVDMQYIEEYHGSVYYCMECIGEIASLLGFASPETVTKLCHELEVESQTSTNLAVQLLKFVKIEEAIENAGYSAAANNLPSSNTSASIVANETVSEDAKPELGNDSKPDENSAESSGSSAKQDLGTVLAATSSAQGTGKASARGKPGI